MWNIEDVKKAIKRRKENLKANSKPTISVKEQIRFMDEYWNKVIETLTKKEVLNLAKEMGIITHHESGKQKSLKSIKLVIRYEKKNECRNLLRLNK
jgi:hypothetical protein